MPRVVLRTPFLTVFGVADPINAKNCKVSEATIDVPSTGFRKSRHLEELSKMDPSV